MATTMLDPANLKPIDHYPIISADCHAGASHAVWGSDYPHDEGTHPYSIERIRYAFHDVDPAETYAMLTGNAAKLYDFDVEKLVPLANEVGPTVDEVQTPLDDESLAKIPRRI